MIAAGRCLACSGDLVFFGDRLDYAYFRCSRCGSLQLDPLPDAESLARAYRERYAESGHSGRLRDPEGWARAAEPFHRAVLATLLRHHPGGPVVDYGCGWGSLAREIRGAGLEVAGVERSEAMAAYARARGIPILGEDFRTLDLRRAPGAFVLCNAFEHLSDPAGWLRWAHASLREGGIVVSLHLTSGVYAALASAWRWARPSRPLPELYGAFAPPWHIALFSIPAMRGLARATGFGVTDIRIGPTRRAGGALGIAQGVLRTVNRWGEAAAGWRWPLALTHLFVLRKLPVEPG